MTGPCKLCGHIRPLLDSHVIPDFIITGAQHHRVTGSKGVSQPFTFVLSTVSNEPGGAKQRGQWEKYLGIKEYLLCGVCERDFSEYEGYARVLLYGKSPQPLKKLLVGSSIAVPAGQPGLEDLIGARRVIAEYKQFKLFQLSLLWRAGVASGSFFKEVDLGVFHESKLRNLLKTQNPGLDTDYACTMFDLRHNGKGCEDWIEPPKKTTDRHQVGYQFIIGGYMYLFTVSKQKPRPSAQLCSIKPTGEMVIIVADAKRILRSRANALHNLGRI